MQKAAARGAVLFSRSLRAAGLAVFAALVLAGCQSTMTATAPTGSLSVSGTPLQFVSIQGPSPELARKFEAILAQEARKRGFEIVSTPQVGKALRVKTYLDAYASEDGKTGFAWVLDTSENGLTRAARIKGAAAMPAPANAAWSALDETAMRQIAQMSVDDLVRHMSGATPLVAALEESN